MQNWCLGLEQDAPSHITINGLYLDSLHALASGISHEIIKADKLPSVLPALQSVVDSTHGTMSEFAAAVIANFALARHSWTLGDRDAAADYYTAAVKAGTDAKAAGVRLGSYAEEKLEGARDNLTNLRLPEGSIAKAAMAAYIASKPGGVAVRVGEPGTQPAIAPSLCAACGKDLATLKCSRCMSVRYCSKECQRAHWKAHKGVCVAPS